jgi:hypothetical protein
MTAPPAGVVLADTITALPPEADGAVIVAGSHGGRYSGRLAAKAGARAVVLNDAGLGLDAAGIGSLALLEPLGIAAATVAHVSGRIGDAADMFSRGRISHANAPARAVGVAPGMPCAEAALLLLAAPRHRVSLPAAAEARGEVAPPDGALRRILLLDSASLVRPEDAGQIVVTGSHGALLGGRPDTAMRGVAAFAAVFNDAGGGPEGSGTSRLTALDQAGVAAFTVAAASARIGEGASSFHDGVVSAVNPRAAALGACIGDRASEVLLRWACLMG